MDKYSTYVPTYIHILPCLALYFFCSSIDLVDQVFFYTVFNKPSCSTIHLKDLLLIFQDQKEEEKKGVDFCGIYRILTDVISISLAVRYIGISVQHSTAEDGDI